MKTSKTFKILFRLVKARKKSEGAPIYVRITVNGNRKEFGADLFCPIDEWDNKANRVSGRSAEARTLNDELDTIKFGLKRSYKDLEREGRFITAEAVIARYTGTDQYNQTVIGLSKYHDQYRLKAKMMAKQRAARLEGSFGTDKEHFLLKK